MSNRVPTIIDPVALSVKRAEVSGVIEASSLERLVQGEVVLSSCVDAKIMFGSAEHIRRANFIMTLSAQFSAQCQRCGEVFSFDVAAQNNFVIVREEKDGANYDDNFEVIVSSEDKLSLYPLIEDELLLALPLVPKHPDGDCDVETVFGDSPAIDTEKVNPFAELAKLKKH